MTNELRTDVKCVLVDLLCERCKGGKLGFQLQKGDRTYVHKCNCCLRSFELDKIYPHVEYVKPDGDIVKL